MTTSATYTVMYSAKTFVLDCYVAAYMVAIAAALHRRGSIGAARMYIKNALALESGREHADDRTRAAALEWVTCDYPETVCAQEEAGYTGESYQAPLVGSQ